MNTPPYRIETTRTVIRCWNPTDAALVKDAIDNSLDHLREWMPWAMNEPVTLEAQAQKLRRFRSLFDQDKDYIYAIFNQDESLVLGGTGLHTRVGKGAFEIGYWIRASHINQGFATEISAALTRAAFELCSVARMEIHCDPHNVRSAAVPRKLGYTHEATLRQRTVTPTGDPRDTMIWALFADEFPPSPAASAQIRAYDLSGQEIRMTGE
ncbi:MAG: GNAT family N-acetyltransferase [Caldilineaceae bacterium]|nr:GNAT family N-acetyltransferase [Caldilineaceae bacterium]